MYGYIKIDKEKLSKGEFGLYHTFLCGICLSTKKQFNNFSRLLSNFDINFFNILFHSYLNVDVKIEQQRCVSSPLKKRTVLACDEVTDKLSVANVILMYINLYDDCLDEKSVSKKIILNSIKKQYHKAVNIAPELNAKLMELYEQLRIEEGKNDNVLDRVCQPFAMLSVEFGKYMVAKTDKYIDNLLYNIGKWVYLIDALDDLDKDNKNKQFNPLIASFGGFTSGKQFVADNLDTLKFVFNTALNRIIQCYNDLNLTKYVCILNNILYYSLRQQTEKVFNKYLPTGEHNV